MTVPVTVLTGFLGAGKTTLLGRLLRGDHGRRLAVIVNEFGEAGIDGEILSTGGEELIELANGCICCTVRGDLLRTLHALRPRIGGIDGVVIETTGLADPGPVAQTFLFDDALRADFALDGIATVVDALHIRDQLAQRPEAAEQVAFADLLILSKADLVDRAELPAIRAELARLNPRVRILVADRGAIPPEAVLDLGGFDLARVERRLLEEPHDHDGCEGGHHADGHHHGPGIATVTLEARAPLREGRVTDWLTGYLAENGCDVLRAKGILEIAGEDRRLVLQGVHMILEADYLGAWPPGPRESRLVLIGRGLDQPALQASFQDCIA